MGVKAALVASVIVLGGALLPAAASSPRAARACATAVVCTAALPTMPTLAASRPMGVIDRYLAVKPRGAALARLDGRVLWAVAVPRAAARPRLVAAGDFTGDRITD